jgi:3-phenylpropionate/trans-cinnamate dioxygenase ferredoxin reductase subunit
MAQAERTVDYLLIGGGLAAATAGAKIREHDAEGTILIVTSDPAFPYHRPPLSKEYLRAEINAEGVYGEGGVYVQLPDWYDTQAIEVLREVTVTGLDTTAKIAQLSDGGTVHYDALLLATGGRPRQLAIPGVDLPGVQLLRSLADADAIREQIAPGQRVVVVGSGFIGLETAASCLTQGAQVTIVEPQARAWPSMVPEAVSHFIQDQFTQHGATLRYGWNVTGLTAGPDGKVHAAQIAPAQEQGAPETLPCDLVIIGVGIALNTELAQAAGLEVDPRHGIVVNERLETRVADVFAAGDVAAFPNLLGQRMHFEHWDNAIASAEVAAANMTDEDAVYRHVPYFFSDLFDLSLNMLGFPAAQAEVVIRGDMATKQFTALYVQDGTLRAALMINDDAQMDLLRDLIAGAAPVAHAQALADPQFDLASLREP